VVHCIGELAQRLGAHAADPSTHVSGVLRVLAVVVLVLVIIRLV
jgi:hypothetical protein